MDDKFCPRCEQSLPIDSFGFDKYRSDARQSVCKSCKKLKSPYPHIKSTPGFRHCRGKCKQVLPLDQFSATAVRCRNCQSKYDAQYINNLTPDQEEHRRQLFNDAARQRMTNLDYRTETNARNRTYVESNRRKIRKYQKSPKGAAAARAAVARRRAPDAYTTNDVLAQHERQHGKCHWCNVKVGDDYHVDHIIPVSRGGSNSKDNIVISCPHCNLSRNDKLPHEWPQGGRLL